MALRRRFQSLTLQHRRLFSSSDTNTLRGCGKERTRAALAALRFEENPERILDLCRSVALTPESHLDRIVFSKAISKLKELNHHDGIRAFIQESMNQPGNRSERYAAHCIILYGQAGLISDALNLFDKMPQIGIERSVKTLNSLLFSCLLGREYGQMRRIIWEFPRKYGLEPNLETYNTLLKGICSSGGAMESHSILAEMERKGIKPSKQTFASVIEGLYSEEHLDDVGKMLHLMKRYDMSPGIGIYNVRIQSLCKLGRLAEAKALLDGILSNGMKPNCRTYGHLIYGFCRQHKLDAAKSLYAEMVGKDLKAEAECLFTLVYYLCQGKDFEGALSICNDSIANGWFPNVTTMSMLVRGLASINKLHEARRIIELLKNRFRRKAQVWDQIEMELPKPTDD
uniref:Pentatricopeptide repeat protein n=1 Tax=Salvia miltiorrhiza TaxID=226208 RepID=A0A678WE21_SALMI|nr:pentatricopeptide repeat protein [Salvia miltiorrhiza]